MVEERVLSGSFDDIKLSSYIAIKDPPRVIGLTGLAGSGKSTVAALLRMRGYQEYAFADALREEVDASLQYPFSLTEIPLDVRNAWMALRSGEVFRKPTSPDARLVLQWWGTEYRRAQDENYWVNKLEGELRPLRHTKLVISDARFINEIDLVWRLRGVVWNIRRPGAAKTAPEHKSENECLAADTAIYNDGLIGDLATKVLEALKA